MGQNSRTDYITLTANLQSKPENEVIAAIDVYIEKYGIKYFIANCNATITVSKNHDEKNMSVIFGSFLYAACSYGYCALAEKLLRLGVDVDVRAKQKEFTYPRYSPVMITCARNDVNLLSLLLPYHPNLSDVHLVTCNGQKGIFASEIYDLLMREAQRSDQLDLLVTGIYPQLTIFNNRSFTSSKKSTYKNVQDSYQYLYGYSTTIDLTRIQNSKIDAVKLANAQFHCLLSNPERCFPMLRFLNQQFEAYLKMSNPDSELPQYPVEGDIEFRNIDGNLYPVAKPGSNLEKQAKTPSARKTQSPLKEFTILQYRKHGIGENVRKCIGFIPHDIADKMVMDGDVFMESNSGPAVFHGIDPHTLQTIMKFFAIECGDITMQYLDNGVVRTLTVRDIIASQYGQMWTKLRDQKLADVISFGDPFRLFSVIMCEGKRLKIETLAYYLIISFLKGIYKYHAVMSSVHPIFSDFDRFIKIMPRCPLEAIPLRSPTVERAIKRLEAKNLLPGAAMQQYSIFKCSNGSAVATRNYQPNPKFVPGTFSREVASQYAADQVCDLVAVEARYFGSQNQSQNNDKLAFLAGLLTEAEFASLSQDVQELIVKQSDKFKSSMQHFGLRYVDIQFVDAAALEWMFDNYYRLINFTNEFFVKCISLVKAQANVRDFLFNATIRSCLKIFLETFNLSLDHLLEFEIAQLRTLFNNFGKRNLTAFIEKGFLTLDHLLATLDPLFEDDLYGWQFVYMELLESRAVTFDTLVELDHDKRIELRSKMRLNAHISGEEFDALPDNLRNVFANHPLYVIFLLDECGATSSQLKDMPLAELKVIMAKINELAADTPSNYEEYRDLSAKKSKYTDELKIYFQSLSGEGLTIS